MGNTVHLSIDLGAGSGRVMAGIFDGATLKLEEIHRFANTGILLPTGWHWNIFNLFGEIKTGLSKAGTRFGRQVRSLAVDTWGVDYGLVDSAGRLLGPPWMYRDERTDTMMELAAAELSSREIYTRTGIQFMFFNTLFQLMAESRSHPRALAAANRILFIPDLLTYWLCGEKITERTIASTSQLLQAGTNTWDLELAKKLGIPTHIFGSITEPGTCVAPLLPELQTELNLPALTVVACGSHDTASAVAGIPAQTSAPLFLSSGTWSLIGRLLDKPLVTEATFTAGFSNEQGLEGKTRFLKNIAGMWLLQECKRNWEAAGINTGYGDLVAQAEQSRAVMLLNPDDAAFAKACDMPAAICNYAKETGQTAPETPAEFTRTILESLAIKYRAMVQQLKAWDPAFPDTLHVVGGGSQNRLLNQMTADSTGLQVVAGPIEATTVGNVLAQLLATGMISSVHDGQEIIRRSFDPEVFTPNPECDWAEKASGVPAR